MKRYENEECTRTRKGLINIEMKAFWKKYGTWIELSVLFVALVLMVGYNFWEEKPEKLWLRWFQFFLFVYYFIDRVIKLVQKYKKLNRITGRTRV